MQFEYAANSLRGLSPVSLRARHGPAKAGPFQNLLFTCSPALFFCRLFFFCLAGAIAFLVKALENRSDDQRQADGRVDEDLAEFAAFGWRYELSPRDGFTIWAAR
jgi:hypothetical protein